MAHQWEAQGKTFIITGGASGLGAAYVETFLKEGAKKIAILDVAEKVGKATAERLNATYPDKVVFIKCDVSDEGNIERAFNEVVDKYKQVDVIINNAGMMVDAPDMWRTACDVNVQGLISFTLKGFKHMSRAEGGAGGTIVNIASTAALTKFRFVPIYNASKIAVLHFSQCLAMDPFYTNNGIRILTICFGPTDTPLMHGLGDRSYESKLGHAFVEELETMMNNGYRYQKLEAAVTAFVHMFKNGQPGSIWLSVNNAPVKEITSDIDRAFQDMTKLIRPD